MLSRKDEILHKMRLVRPVVETGYENLVQVRCLLEDAAGSEAAKTSVERMLKSWSTEMLPAAMKKYKLDRSELVEKFGSYRDDWMRRDLRSWLESNSFYPGVCEAVAHARDNAEAYVVTTKQARFALALLREIGRIPFEEDRVFSQTVSGRPKSEVLAMLEQRHDENETSFHFVEDKLSTLEKVAADESMKKWNLYLVDWGYNTEEERERARGNERIEVVGVERFRGYDHEVKRKEKERLLERGGRGRKKLASLLFLALFFFFFALLFFTASPTRFFRFPIRLLLPRATLESKMARA